ncbi:MAG: hypothetical protein KDA85_12425 [Planctomycetaceae bacterium]|nr:hypothetical protein [Planctomycetaceae bacterium]
MKPQEIEEFRSVLKLLQARLRGDVAQLKEEALAGADSGAEQRSSNHMAEMGSDAWDLDFSLQLVESDEGLLIEISEALQRIEAGTYGVCESCHEQGKPESRCRIPKARLKAIPYARNCVDCERLLEQQR